MLKKTPADVVLDLLGVRPLARALDLTPGALCHWRKKGLVPSDHHAKILAFAKQQRKRLTADMLVYGSGA